MFIALAYSKSSVCPRYKLILENETCRHFGFTNLYKIVNKFIISDNPHPKVRKRLVFSALFQ